MPGRKNSMAIVLARRNKIRPMILDGMTQRAISEKLGTPLRTIENDCRAIAKELAREYDSYESKSEVVKILGQFNEAFNELKATLKQLKKQKNTHIAQIRVLSEIGSLIDKRAKTMSRFGVVPTAPTRVEANVSGDDPFGIERMMGIIREKKEKEGK